MDRVKGEAAFGSCGGVVGIDRVKDEAAFGVRGGCVFREPDFRSVRSGRLYPITHGLIVHCRRAADIIEIHSTVKDLDISDATYENRANHRAYKSRSAGNEETSETSLS